MAFTIQGVHFIEDNLRTVKVKDNAKKVDVPTRKLNYFTTVTD